MMAQTTRLADARSWLLASIFFCIPLSIAPAYILTGVLLVLTLIEGQYKEKLQLLRGEPLVWIFVAYFFVFVLSLLWTEEMQWGLRMVRRQMFFLLFPLYLLAARREHLVRYISAFLLSIGLCEVLAYYNFLDVHVWPGLPDGVRVDKDHDDTAPFVDRIMYAPVLALAAYLALHRMVRSMTVGTRLGYAVLFLATVGNLLFSGGRSGIAGFLVLLVLFVFQLYARRKLLATSIASLAVLVVLGGGYVGNDYFRERVDLAVENVRTLEKDSSTSLALRLTYYMNAWRMFSAHPFLGVGVGDYPTEYKKLNSQYSPDVEPAWNPHNQYLYALTAAGLPGGVLLMLVLLVPMLQKAQTDGREHLRKAVPLLLLTICLAESYLIRSNTSLMYVAFTAALWCGATRVKP